MKTITEQTGWNRNPAAPLALCQDIDVLKRISEYDFDYSAPEFREYCKRRGIVWLSIAPKYLETTIKVYSVWSDERIRKDYFKESITGYQYDDDDKDGFMQILRIQKGKLQDCWELYRASINSKLEVSDGVENERGNFNGRLKGM